MISTQNLLRKFLLPIVIVLTGALLFITNKKSSNMLQNADLNFGQEFNSNISSSLIANILPELNQDIYESARSGKDVKIQLTKRGKISHLSDFVSCQGKNLNSSNVN